MKKILVSRCLLNERVRFNGKILYVEIPLIRQWNEMGIVVPFCPEVEAGLSVPRNPCEISGGSGADVLERKASILDSDGNDLSDIFIDGAMMTLELARKEGVVAAVLKNGSPSCGSSYVYDGTFEHRKVRGKGVTTTLLEHNDIKVFNENETFYAQKYLLSMRT